MTRKHVEIAARLWKSSREYEYEIKVCVISVNSTLLSDLLGRERCVGCFRPFGRLPAQKSCDIDERGPPSLNNAPHRPITPTVPPSFQISV